jgi:hypothetical protein
MSFGGVFIEVEVITMRVGTRGADGMVRNMKYVNSPRRLAQGARGWPTPMQTPTTTRHGPTCLANVCFTQCGTRGDEAVELAFPRGSCTWVFECAVGRAYAIKNSPSDAYDTERWVRAAAGPTYATHVDSVVPKTTLLLVPIPGRVAVN